MGLGRVFRNIDFNAASLVKLKDPNFLHQKTSESEITHKNGLTEISASRRDDVINLKYNADGSATVTINGNRTHLNAEQARNIVINGKQGDDLISVSGEPPADAKLALYGDDGNDTIFGGSGNEYFDGGRGHDTMYGGDGDDTMRGGWGSFSDTIYGEGGNDTISGGNGDDFVHGGDGDDRVNGDKHNDQVYGGAGNDYVFGGDHNDVLFGGPGVDVMDGGRGSDHEFQDPVNETPGSRPDATPAQPEPVPSRPIKPPYPIVITPFPQPEHPCCCHNHYHDLRPTLRADD